MRLTELTRRPPSWLQIAFTGLVVAFVLSSIAHLTHRHEALAATTNHVVACGYCLSSGGLADAGVHCAPLLASGLSDERIFMPTPLVRPFQSPSSAQPRGPPAS